jgi:dTDP-4-amino-4,6-dideoxygalactose transaminase
MIPLCKPIFNEEMKEAAIHALQNEYFVLGESVFKFEEEFAKYHGVKHAISVNSGTTALHLSLLALNVKSGDKIITTPMTFVATSNVILYVSGKPMFTDINEATGNIDTSDLRKDGAKGIIPVHLYGNPCDIDKLLELKEKEFFIIEDVCQAHGAEYKRRKVGTFGDVGCFSFYSTKNMTVAGDGGMVITNDDKIAETIRSLRDCGREYRGKKCLSKYKHVRIGFTARLNTVNAAIARVQLKYLDKWNEKRRQIAKLYRELLPKEILLEEQKNSKPVYHLFVVKVKNREKVIKHLEKNGIQTGIHYPIPVHLQPIYKELFGYKEGMFPKAEKFAKEVLSLPMFPELKKDEVKYICEKLNEVLE